MFGAQFGEDSVQIHCVAPFVYPTAPNMTQASHVSDSEKDLMYEGEVRGPWTPSELDVNNDDYFNHGRHWLDLADSAFLQGPRHNGKDRPPDWAVRDLKSVSGKPKKSAPWRASNQGEVKFHNATDGQVQIYWIDDEMGRRVHMRSLDSWMSYASSTSADQYRGESGYGSPNI